MAIPQVQAALKACDRRDAVLAVSNLETTHAAVAPVMVGREGSKVFEKCMNYLRKIITSEPASDASSAFKKLMAKSRG